MALTPKQKQVFDFVSSYKAEHGYAPSQQEIAKNFGFRSLGTVQNYLVRLEREGILRKTWNARRGMEVAPITTQSPTVPLPLLGRVAAGRPIEVITQEESVDVPASLLKGEGEHFVLRVSGQSMIEDGILEGDYVVVKKQVNAHNGQTVIALIGNEATIKRYYRRGNRIELHPANPAFEPLILDSWVDAGREFKIEGILVGVIRRFD